MMKTFFRLSLLAATLAFVPTGAYCPASATCPLHHTLGTYQGDSYPPGHHVRTFKCSSGHTFDIVCD